MESWLFYALLSAVSAALVSIFGKVGLAGVRRAIWHRTYRRRWAGARAILGIIKNYKAKIDNMVKMPYHKSEV